MHCLHYVNLHDLQLLCLYVNCQCTFVPCCHMSNDHTDVLFERINDDDDDDNDVVHRLLPPQRYNLSSRRHTLQLPEHHTRLLDSNFFLVRMLYKDCY